MKIRIRLSRKNKNKHRVELSSRCLRYPTESGVRFGKGQPAPKKEPEKEDKK